MEFKNLITLTQVSDGAPGAPGGEGGYYIETNTEEVAYFFSQGENGDRIVSADYPTLSFAVYEFPKNSNSVPADFSDSYGLEYYRDGVFNKIKLDEILDYLSFGRSVADDNGNESIEDKNVLFFRIFDYLKSQSIQDEDGLLKFIYLKEGNEIATKIIPYRKGFSNEMAQFNISATKIQQAIGDSLISFEPSGLKIYETGLEIWDKKGTDGTRLFYFDKGNLYVKGIVEATNGKFHGEIEATDASFEGGTIGGFNISQDYLSTTNGNITLDGTSGEIYAKNITLGTGAQVERYIKVGNNAFIYNPDIEGNRFIEAGAIRIKADGTATLGDIQIDGNNSIISGNRFSISPDHAEFSNVTVSGKINAAVFNTETTSAVGSSMIFSPTFKVEGCQGSEITVDSEVQDKIHSGNNVWLITDKNNYYTGTVTGVASKTVTISEQLNLSGNERVISLIVIGENGSLIFGINSGNSKIADNLIYPRGLTINKYGNEKLPSLFLGDLTSLGNSYSGYGLYSDNVYLNGSLTTRINDNSYAGVNTLGLVNASIFDKEDYYPVNPDNHKGDLYKFDNGKYIKVEDRSNLESSSIYYGLMKDTSPIVFWGGSTSTDKASIQNSKFQVTENGSLYAAHAEIKNSLLVGGEIKGSDIYAARIHGWSNEDNNYAALTIYDTTNGISFQTKEQVKTFSINSDGLYAGEKKFISINDGVIDFNGNQITGGKIKTAGEINYLSMDTYENIPRLYHQQTSTQNCGFYFESDRMSYKINNQSKTIWSNTDIKMLGTISFLHDEDDVGYFQYKSVPRGYDLYVTY